MNILHVYPEFPDTFWSFKHALKFIRRKAGAPPLGLLTIAAMLPTEWRQRLVDTNVTTLTAQDLVWADYVFLSAMVIQRDSAQAIIDQCRQAGAKIVAGGPLFTSEPELFQDQVDHLILNEAELTLQPFLEDLERGTPQKVYRTDDFADMTTVPNPLWHLADLNRYATMAIQFSRGCPFNCDFCNITALLGRKVRTKTAEQIITELDTLYNLGWRDGVFFVDDNFIGNKRLLKSEILPALIEWRRGKPGMPFNTEASVNLADDEELMDMMVQAGFDTVFVGIETPNEDSLAECGKVQNKGRDLVQSVRNMHQAGLQVQGGFIVGFDHDTPSVFQQQIDFIQRSGIVTAMVGLLQAPYGTELYARMKREGRLLDEMSGNNVDLSTNIIPKMNMDVLREGYVRILDYIYEPKNYYDRVMTLLKDSPNPLVQAPIDKDHLMAFFRSIFRLGIRGRERLHYWKLFFWTLFHKPKLFPQAITLAIYGFHFRKVCDMHIQ
jgi:radical SAM superfamily enzyme YgiQ (UPF0313 family)